MLVVYSSFDGRYSDNPRALYERYSRRGDDDHVWLCHPLIAGAFRPTSPP